MATALDLKQLIFFDELLMSQVVHAEALTRLLVEKGVITREEFTEMVKVVDREIKRKGVDPLVMVTEPSAFDSYGEKGKSNDTNRDMVSG